MKKLVIILIVLTMMPLAYARSDISVFQGQYYIGNSFQTGTYKFNFTIFDSLEGGNIVYSNETNITTGTWGQWKIELEGVSFACNNASKDYFVNINIEGIDQSPRRRLTIFDYLRKDVADAKTGNLIINDVLKGLSPLRLEEVLSFVNPNTEEEDYSFYVGRDGMDYSNVPNAFNNSLIFQTTNITNKYQMEVCFWDKENQRMIMCLNEGAPSRATTIRRSLQIVGNLTVKENDENFTLCENANYIDCSTDVTGADLFVQDDIEVLGSIYANEEIYAEEGIDTLDGLGVPTINAINISCDKLNTDLIQSTLGQFTNITMDHLVIDTIRIATLSGSGNDYACLDSEGILYRSDTACG